MDVLLVLVKLLHYLPTQDGRDLGEPVLQLVIQLLEVVESEVADVDQSSDLHLSKVLVNQLPILLLHL